MNRGKPNWEHLNDELHVLITVEDTENRARVKMKRALEEIQKLLVPTVSSHFLSSVISIHVLSRHCDRVEGFRAAVLNRDL